MKASRQVVLLFCALLATLVVVPQIAAEEHESAGASVVVLADGFTTPVGSVIGPDGALYVPDNAAGTVVRVDVESGETSVFASGFPKAVAPIGGPVDVVFRDGTAYVLVSLVGPFFGTDDDTGVYRVDGPGEHTLIADLGTWAAANQQVGVEWEAPIVSGVHTAIENYGDGFVVTDAHNNLVLEVGLDGSIAPWVVLDNVAPSGMEVDGDEVYVALTGPIPHAPEDGQIMRVGADGVSRLVASGAPLLLDVEHGPGGLYGLAQGPWDAVEAGDPSDPNGGSLVRVTEGGGMAVLVDGLNLPTSMEIVGDTAYVVGLDGTITRIDNFDPDADPDFDATPELAEGCNARTSLDGVAFHNRSSGQSSGDLGQLSAGPGDTIEMTWDGALDGHEDCVVSLALYLTSVSYFDRSENQPLAAAAMSVAGGRRSLTITVPAGIEHAQIDAVLGRPLLTVGPNGGYYSQSLNGERGLLIDHWNG